MPLVTKQRSFFNIFDSLNLLKLSFKNSVFMKYFRLLLAALLLPFAASAQIYNPVKWETGQKSLGNDEYELYFTATIDDHWHLYSQNLPSEDGPIATFFDYQELSGVELVGKTTEDGKMVTEYDPNFMMDLNYYEHTVTFRQKVKGSGSVKGEYGFMVCDAEKCLPPEYVPFEFTLSAETGAIDFGVSGDVAAGGLGLEGDADGHNEGIYDPVSWTYGGKQLDGNLYELTFTAEVQEHWHLYSQHLPSEDGPVATFFDYMTLEGTTLEGETTENGTLLTEYDPNFDMDLNYFEGNVFFSQQVRLEGESGTVKGEYGFMACNDERCTPPQYIPFEFAIADGAVVFVDEAPAAPGDTPPADVSEGAGFVTDKASIDLENPASECGSENEVEGKSLWAIFLLGFGGGLLALLTPCVFPMIPLTVSFFTKGSENRRKGIFKAVMYGAFIFLVYIILSIPFHLVDSLDPNILNSIGTNPWLNLLFFAVFIVFAISFFGYFEITLPSSWTTKTDSQSDKGGMLGVFFMALTLALVSFSCTGPILGSLLVGSLTSDGGAMQLTSGMAGFGLALALPFALFAMFPGWLNSLPKSGGWLNSVKVVLGFMEVALAIKFFSQADLVKHWNLMPIELFLALWILCGIGLALYLFGKIKFPHDSPLTRIPPLRMALGVLTLAFVVYLASGYRYNERSEGFTSLTLISGVAPPAGYSWIYPASCPQGLMCFKDYEEGLAYAREHDKPIMIDFTGHGCANCRRMEEQVWGKPGVYEKLQNDYVLISLYVDDREPLPADKQTIVTNSGTRKARNVGDKWATFQAETFEANSQPLYCLISPDEQLLNVPVGTSEVDEYNNFLQCGLDAWQNMQQLSQNTEK